MLESCLLCFFLLLWNLGSLLSTGAVMAKMFVPQPQDPGEAPTLGISGKWPSWSCSVCCWSKSGCLDSGKTEPCEELGLAQSMAAP